MPLNHDLSLLTLSQKSCDPCLNALQRTLSLLSDTGTSFIKDIVAKGYFSCINVKCNQTLTPPFFQGLLEFIQKIGKLAVLGSHSLLPFLLMPDLRVCAFPYRYSQYKQIHSIDPSP